MSRLEAQQLLDNLGIREEAINDELERSPTLSYSAASAAVDAKKDLRLFEDGAYAAYMAHVRRYARLYLKAIGDKDTISNVDDTVILLFSRNTTSETRKDAAISITDYRLGTAKNPKELRAYKDDVDSGYEKDVTDTYKDMYRYCLQQPQKYYEWFSSTKVELDAAAKRAEAAAAAFKERAHCLVAIAANLRAAGDIDAYGAKPFTADVIERVKRASLKNPKIETGILIQMAEDTWKSEKSRNGGN